MTRDTLPRSRRPTPCRTRGSATVLLALLGALGVLTVAGAGLAPGEAVAIAVLEELRLAGNELFTGLSLRRFDGTRVRVG